MKKWIKPALFGLLFFTAGLLAYWGLQAREVRADQYSCIRTDLNASAMTGNIPNPRFKIIYDIPSCYAEAGYRATEVRLHGSNRIMVTYEKN